MIGAVHAHAAPTAVSGKHREFPRNRAMDWAVRQQGCWYEWGGTGPCGDGYDCSGLVYSAYRAIGIRLPRTTYEMLASSMLVRTYHPKRGDLAFYGSGHVELVTRFRHTTFGAQEPGTRVGWHRWGGSWHPTAFYAVKGAG
jgi:cell wall-associated NlpC family hydrolase